MATESPKRVCRVPVNLSEREMLDLSALATADNRSPGDMLYVVLRRYMYGRVGAARLGVQQSRSASEALVCDFADTSFDPGSVA